MLVLFLRRYRNEPQMFTEVKDIYTPTIYVRTMEAVSIYCWLDGF